MSDPLITVAMPVYNGERYLAQTLDSLLAQRFAQFEVLCADDCSTDGSLQVLRDYAARDGRVRVRALGANLGTVPKVLNALLPDVRGRYFVYTSQDDLFSEDWLNKLYRRAEATGADATLPDVVFFREGELNSAALVGRGGDRDAVLTGAEATELSLDWRIPGNALWRADLVRRVGYYDFAMDADEYTARVLFSHCNRVVFCDGVFYYRQDNPGAITKKLSPKTFDRAYTHFRLYQFLVERGFARAVCDGQLDRAVASLLEFKRQATR